MKLTSPAHIRSRGLEALAKALGPVGMVRFLQQFESGSGDYTRDRQQWLDKLTIEEVIRKIKKVRKPAAK